MSAYPGGMAAPTSYEEARAELAQIVQRLEAGTGSLEEALGLWERGEELAAYCAGWLEGALERIAQAPGETADATTAPGTPTPDEEEPSD